MQVIMASMTTTALQHLALGMDDDNFTASKAESVVKDLQQLLFPVSPRKASSDSYLCNFLLKTTNAIEFDDERISQIVRFKDSKEYISRDLDCAAQPPRWPTECQVIEDCINHISYVPSFPEPYYTPTGREVQPKPVGEECGIVVYQYYPISAVNYFSRSSVGGSRYLLPTCPCPEEETLRFESRFESGNLAKAIKITNTYYELYLRNDMYTSKHTQWFYFKVSKMRKNVMYRFSIVNLSKEGSLYNEGMKMLMYSERDAQMHSIGWRRCGDNITYFCNENVTPDDPDQQQLYTLTFTLEFPHDEDAVYLAHSYPYTYTDLQNYLQELTTHPIKSTYSNLRLLCRTLAGNNVYYVTITSPQTAGDGKKKQAIVITARVHPGETPSSWMMKGFLDFLTSDSGPAKELRDKFIFKLVPMLNPDGVIVGNNRCSLTGRDLNRQYRTVIRETYPSIWYTKLMIRRLLEECGVAMYCDLHAHSRKHNIFIYGCENRRGLDRRLHEQVFPLMLHKNAADKFSFENCKFRVQRCKEGTGRVVMWMMGIANSFTMEASFGGSMLSTRSDTHFTTADYEMMGKSFCQTLLDFYDDDPRKERLRVKIISRLVKEGSNADEPTNIQLSDYSSDSGDTSSSEEEGGGPEDAGTLIVPPPSPATTKRIVKPKSLPSRAKPQVPKSPTIQRKPLPVHTVSVSQVTSTISSFQISKANLGISFNNQDSIFTSDIDSSSCDTEPEVKEKVKMGRRRRKKKKVVTKKQQNHVRLAVEYSDSEVQIKRQTERCVSMFELLPESRLRSQSWHRGLKIPTIRNYLETKRSTAQQLAEVQAKLLSLRNKLWFGVGDTEIGGSPLSWGSSTFAISTNLAQISHGACKPLPKQNKKKNNKHDKEKKIQAKKPTRDCKETLKDKTFKKDKANNCLKRQTAIDWLPPATTINEKIRKLKGLTETTAKFANIAKNPATMCSNMKKLSSIDKEDGKVKKPKKLNNRRKKAKETKLEKTAKTVTNANLFIRKD